MGARELGSELEGVFATHVAYVVGELPDGFVGAPARKPRVAELKVRNVPFQIRGRINRIDHSGGRGKLIIAREAGVDFIQQIAAPGMAPAGAGVVIAHEGVGQSAPAEESSLRAEDEPVWRIEPVPVQTKVETVVFRVPVIDLGK